MNANICKHIYFYFYIFKHSFVPIYMLKKLPYTYLALTKS